MHRLLTLKQAAETAQIHRVTLMRWVMAGKVRASYVLELAPGKVIYLWTPRDAKALRRLKRER